MSALLERLLEWLAALNCSVVLLSATLPREKRQALLRAWTGDAAPEQTPKDDTPYPRLTIAVGDTVKKIHVQPADDRRVVIRLEWRERDRLLDDIEGALRDGGCAAVIRNTVGEAQETFRQLRGLRESGYVVELFHARFPFARRQDIEQGVLGRYGKGFDGKPCNPSRPTRAVLVATQVIEQSLDLDFDLLVTDMAPVDLVLQRAGRLHRHKREDRPIKTAPLWLLKPKNTEAVPDFGVSQRIYDCYILLRSFLALRERATISLPDDIDRMIEEVYSCGCEPSDVPWRTALDASRTCAEQHRRDDRQVASAVIIESPVFEDDILELFNRQLEEDNPDAHHSIQAATRLTRPSVTLVLLHRASNGTLSLTPDGTQSVDLSRSPGLAEAKQLLGNAVTLQDHRVLAHFVAQVPPPAWRQSGLLRFHRLAVLDSDACYRTEKCVMRVDEEQGIMIESISDH
jgi:CRISPR-associated endonuclease/helicase Cas3